MLIDKKCRFYKVLTFERLLKILSGNVAEDVNFSPLFYDIETTGLGRNSSFFIFNWCSLHESVPGSYISGLNGFREESIIEFFSEFMYFS